jgi:23S rRNA (adenine2030-N6)-methyltransferase
VNYHHAYHAGSFTDVIKHITLTALILLLKRKDTPFCYIDTHAGPGYYDLFSESALKTQEYKNGIEKIIQQENPPDLIKRYLDCVHKINNQLTGSTFASLRYYPGSPLIARYLIRPHDRIIACELQLQEYQELRSAFAGDKQVATIHMDGFLSLKAHLPPKERRALVLIDPPYENPDEFTRIAHSLPIALKRFAGGTYAIWYPIKEKALAERFYRTLKAEIKHPIYIIELTIYPDLPHHLNGGGLAIINPPWQFNDIIDQALPWTWKALTINHQGAYHAFMLK